MLCILATVRPSDDKTDAGSTRPKKANGAGSTNEDDELLVMLQGRNESHKEQRQELQRVEQCLEKEKKQNEELKKEHHTMRLAQEVSIHVIPHRPCCAYCA